MNVDGEDNSRVNVLALKYDGSCPLSIPMAVPGNLRYASERLSVL